MLFSRFKKSFRIVEICGKFGKIWQIMFALVDKSVDTVYNVVNIVDILQISTGIYNISVENRFLKGIMIFHAESDKIHI